MIDKVNTKEELADIGIANVKDHHAEIFVNKAAVECSEKEAVAKIIYIADEKNIEVKKPSYHIKHYRGQLFNPYGDESLKANSPDTKYKRVSESIFNTYVQYLKTRREIFLTNARREFIRGSY